MDFGSPPLQVIQRSKSFEELPQKKAGAGGKPAPFPKRRINKENQCRNLMCNLEAV